MSIASNKDESVAVDQRCNSLRSDEDSRDRNGTAPILEKLQEGRFGWCGHVIRDGVNSVGKIGLNIISDWADHSNDGFIHSSVNSFDLAISQYIFIPCFLEISVFMESSPRFLCSTPSSYGPN